MLTEDTIISIRKVHIATLTLSSRWHNAPKCSAQAEGKNIGLVNVHRRV